MNDLSGFKADWLDLSTIWKYADDFRKKYTDESVPIRVEEIIEFDLKLTIREKKNLYLNHGVNAYYPNNGKEIYIDEDDFFGGKKIPLMRYTLAHEIGHIEMHGKYLSVLKSNTIEEWKEKRRTLPPSQYGALEFQAYEFAGRFLVPSQLLKEALSGEVSYVKSLVADYPDFPLYSLQEIAARNICNEFGVSEKVVFKRINVEKIDIFNP